jgi:tripartite-type tricarboxylate transporter receptor subunit TctC
MAMRPFRHFAVILALAASVAAFAPESASAAYPDKPVHVVVPFAPGGATDVVARSLATRLSQIWGQPVIVENRPGAGGNIGADMVAKAAADGYTVLLASPAEIVINPHLYAHMPYDPAKDLAPVTKIAAAPLVLVVHPSVPAHNVAELVAWIKSQTGGVSYASSGTGGPQHPAAEQFRLMTDTSLVHVPYKGGAPAVNDLLAGQVPMFFAGLPPALPHIKAGTLRALAVTTSARWPSLPDVPTVAESGLPGFDIENWQGIFVPAGTPPGIVGKLARDIATVAGEKEFADRLTAQGAAPATLSPADFAIFVRAENLKYARLVKESGAKVE